MTTAQQNNGIPTPGANFLTSSVASMALQAKKPVFGNCTNTVPKNISLLKNDLPKSILKI